MSWDLLQRFLESDVFNANPFLSVSYLSRYADHVGIHYVLCNKLRQFPYEDIEFFLPQLCHLIISVDNESMALEEFLLDLCEESVTAALLTFWLFQTYLHDLSSNPQSNAFQTCRRVYNKVQHIVFGLADTARQNKIKENVLPVAVLSSFVLASVALPMIPRWAGPLAVAQARKPQPITEDASDGSETPKPIPPATPTKPTRANTIASPISKPRRVKEPKSPSASDPHPEMDARPSPRRAGSQVPISHSPLNPAFNPDSKRPSALDMKSLEARLSTASLPLPSPRGPSRPATPVSAGVNARPSDGIHRRHSHHFKSHLSPTNLSPAQKAQLLRQHYFRSQTHAIQGVDPDLDEEEAAPVDPNINASAGRERMENDIKTGGVQRRGDRDDPSAAVFGEAWEAKKERIRKSSPYGWMKNWDLVSVIVKTGADLRQEAFACQLISVCHKIWVEAKVDVWVKLMRILVTGESSGLIETIANGVSLHSLKRSLTLASIEAGTNPRHRIATLKDHFIKAFGQPDSKPYKAGLDAFKRSLAAYSIISYILQLKDRHNGNVLIDSEGHIIHIDFGFMLSNSPGSVGFEAAPFKLTHEYVDVLGGLNSPDFEDYKKLCKQAFQALRRSADYIIDLVAMMGRDSKMPCFAVGVAHATTTLRQRFQLHLSADEAENFVETDLIAKSYGSYYTRLYDTFQYRTQGIY
ncbi:kinase-like protein [Trichoderma longibrachiatum ATCC 18648]|uniref:1-phosphatidylinositol 4-kinase n=1 Tax=Trichoderma longibrachiatum ATCC 18648 TaxID=983965 RepID=A0A2T4BUE2_TRILO|nr:kinase-like protein [Trichoderma longibrachiatum ATCC 18648]